MIGDAFRQLERGGVRHRAGLDFGQGKAGVLGAENQIGGQSDLETAPYRHAVDRGDHRFVEIG